MLQCTQDYRPGVNSKNYPDSWRIVGFAVPDKNESFCRAHNKFISGELLFSLGVLMGENRLVYMDHAATTFIKPEVVETMLPFERPFRESFFPVFNRQGRKNCGNCEGKACKGSWSQPRRNLLHFRGTESDNWAVKRNCFCQA